MKAGDKGPLVPVLRQRLIAEGDLSRELASGTTFDAALTSAVKQFQARHGDAPSPPPLAVAIQALDQADTPCQRDAGAVCPKLFEAGAKPASAAHDK